MHYEEEERNTYIYIYINIYLFEAIDSKLGLGKCIGLRNAAVEVSRDSPKVVNNTHHRPAYVLFCVFHRTASCKICTGCKRKRLYAIQQA